MVLIIVKFGLLYFTLVFVAGFILGGIRVLFVVPQIGERYAELIEMPLMLVVIFFSARFVVRKLPEKMATSTYLYMDSGAYRIAGLRVYFGVRSAGNFC